MIQSPLFRAFVVSSLYLTATLLFEAGLLKATIVWIITFALQILPLGRRYVEGFGFVFIVCATFYWTDILPVKKAISLAKDKLSLSCEATAPRP